jgi:hypothetical protein
VDLNQVRENRAVFGSEQVMISRIRSAQACLKIIPSFLVISLNFVQNFSRIHLKNVGACFVVTI